MARVLKEIAASPEVAMLRAGIGLVANAARSLARRPRIDTKTIDVQRFFQFLGCNLQVSVTRVKVPTFAWTRDTVLRKMSPEEYRALSKEERTRALARVLKNYRRPADPLGYEGDFFEECKNATWWARRTRRNAERARG